ncbi:hypothetical protein MJO28_001594 [Puccinia striiformis f. sp. tritici]|uniref:Uncharacterized protein n=2 Tax=Puccinia striiformis TaxID=27350 RepID=A0A2S4WC57_9BASI|nr:hypothetical protein MJO28_001594 [Puccinia striiformis f. sp. tritici]POW19297.1 hypothetical protein PSHT_04851 [Puccinia striiformis]
MVGRLGIVGVMLVASIMISYHDCGASIAHHHADNELGEFVGKFDRKPMPDDDHIQTDNRDPVATHRHAYDESGHWLDEHDLDLIFGRSESTEPTRSSGRHQIDTESSEWGYVRPNSLTTDHQHTSFTADNFAPDNEKVTTESRGPPRKKRKKPTKDYEMIAGRRKRDGLRTARYELFMRIFAGHPLGRSDPFDVSMVELRTFGWISSLKYPIESQQAKLAGMTKILLASKIWQRLRNVDHEEGVPALIRRLIESGEVSKQDALERARALLWELCVRQIDFLVAFTAPQSEAISRNHQGRSDGLRIQEHNNLLSWFLGELELTNNDPVTTAIAHEAGGSHELSSLQLLIINHLKVDLEVKGVTQATWTTKPIKKRLVEPQLVTVQKAKRTQVAINLLGSYYKASNPKKWKTIFGHDTWFLNLFLYYKAYEHNANFSRTSDREPEWASLALFPWSSPAHDFKFYDDQLNQDQLDILLRLCYSLSHVKVASIDKHFVNL